MQHYVLGFMFSADLQRVALITKNRPQWQAGLLNGVGGKIEPAESAHHAMCREFYEEAGILHSDWQRFAVMTDHRVFCIDVFVSSGDVEKITSLTDEKVSVYPVAELHDMPAVDNVHWLVLLAAGVLRDGRPGLVRVDYPAATT